MFNASSSKRRLRRSRLEMLEPRYVLDSTVVFNELLYNAEDGNCAGMDRAAQSDGR